MVSCHATSRLAVPQRCVQRRARMLRLIGMPFVLCTISAPPSRAQQGNRRTPAPIHAVRPLDATRPWFSSVGRDDVAFRAQRNADLLLAGRASSGRRSRSYHVMLGTVSGLLVGTGIGLIIGHNRPQPCPSCDVQRALGPLDYPIRWGVAGAVAGAAIGAVWPAKD